MMDRRPIAVVDLDGVVADVRHRLHFVQSRPKDWYRFFAAARTDPAHPEGLAVVARLADDHEIVSSPDAPTGSVKTRSSGLRATVSARTDW